MHCSANKKKTNTLQHVLFQEFLSCWARSSLGKQRMRKKAVLPLGSRFILSGYGLRIRLLLDYRFFCCHGEAISPSYNLCGEPTISYVRPHTPRAVRAGEVGMALSFAPSILVGKCDTSNFALSKPAQIVRRWYSRGRGGEEVGCITVDCALMPESSA